MTTDALESAVRWVQDKATKEFKALEDKTLAISCAGIIRPWTAGDYKAGDIRTQGKTPYECMVDHNSIINPDWTIDVRSLWKPYHSRKKEWALPFIHPTGAHDIYKSGEYMTYQDKAYLALEDTAYSPDEYSRAWEVQDE